MWKWNVIEDVSEPEELDTSKEVESEDNEREETESDSNHEAVAATRGTHTVTFKCISATKTPELQGTLKTASELLA